MNFETWVSQSRKVSNLRFKNIIFYILHFLKKMPRHVFKILAKRKGTYNIIKGGHLIEGALIKFFFKHSNSNFIFAKSVIKKQIL